MKNILITEVLMAPILFELLGKRTQKANIYQYFVVDNLENSNKCNQ